MWKQILPSCLILSGLLALSLYCSRCIHLLTDECMSQLTHAQQLAEDGDWKHARTLTTETSKTWQSHSLPLYAILHHNEADEVLLSFCAVEEYLKLEEMDEYAAANAALIKQLELLAEVHQPSLMNVL